jgi:hypothetical protein
MLLSGVLVAGGGGTGVLVAGGGGAGVLVAGGGGAGVLVAGGGGAGVLVAGGGSIDGVVGSDVAGVSPGIETLRRVGVMLGCDCWFVGMWRGVWVGEGGRMGVWTNEGKAVAACDG